MNNNNGQKTRALRNGDRNILHPDYKGIKWLKGEIDRIREISDYDEQWKEYKNLVQICSSVEGIVYNIPDKPLLIEFRSLYDRLKSLRIGSRPNSPRENNTSTCQYCGCNGLVNPYIWNNKQFCSNNYCFEQWKLPCDECGNYRQGNNWQRSDEDDDKRFCSKKCFNYYYAETCDKCQQKALGTTYYSDSKNKTGILCSECNKEEIVESEKEIERIRKEINQPKNPEGNQEEPKEESPVVYCRFCNDKSSSTSNLCDKTECLLKHDEEYARKHNIPFDKKSRERERERERERAKSTKTATITHNYSASRTKS